MARSPLLEILRRETRSEHAALERTAPMVTLLSETVSLDDYRRVLSAMRSVYDPLEQALLPALTPLAQQYGRLPYSYVPASG